MWRPHLWNFLSRVWAEVLSWHSATTYSVFRETIIIPLAILLVSLFANVGRDWYRWAIIKTHGRDVIKSFLTTVIILVVLLGAAMLVAVPIVVYRDHAYLVGVNEERKLTVSKISKERDGWKEKAERIPPKLTVRAWSSTQPKPGPSARHLDDLQIESLSHGLGTANAQSHAVIICIPKVTSESDREERKNYGGNISEAFTRAHWKVVVIGTGTPFTDYRGTLLVWRESQPNLAGLPDSPIKVYIENAKSSYDLIKSAFNEHWEGEKLRIVNNLEPADMQCNPAAGYDLLPKVYIGGAQ